VSREIWFSNFKQGDGNGPPTWVIVVAVVVIAALAIWACT
jgi:hypothetical protein